MTNTFEGRDFVDANPPITNMTQFSKEIFPLLTPEQMRAVATLYAKYNASFPSVEDQAVAMMGEGMLFALLS